ncbi:MAG: magnesium/cobalt transporter CorA [Armatimonadetes bacterium]|nr:magnesium/cobalt transporter CorA [Armatimonadota bacterium]
MYNSYLIKQGEIFKKDILLEEAIDFLKEEEFFIWIDFYKPTIEEIEYLKKFFNFHPLSLEDCLHFGQRPKIEEYNGYSFIVTYEAFLKEEEFDTNQIGIFFGHKFFITIHLEEVFAIKGVIKRLEDDEKRFKIDCGYFLYHLMDEVVDNYFLILNKFEESIDLLESQVLVNQSTESLNKIFHLRKTLINFRKICSPQREVLNNLISRVHPQINEIIQTYLRDVYDHLIRLYDITETNREILSNAMEIYLTMTSNRLNETMKKLTVLATFFMPITFIAGLLGMNIKFPPIITYYDTGNLFWIILILMGTINLYMIYFFIHKRWL